jgi:hypothetical protein
VNPVMTYSSFEIHPAGIVLHGKLSMAEPFPPPVVVFDVDPATAGTAQPEWSALNSWIPGGTVTSFSWSFSGRVQPLEVNTFISSNVPPGWSHVCLTIGGLQTKWFPDPIPEQVVGAGACRPISQPGIGPPVGVISFGGSDLPYLAVTFLDLELGLATVIGHTSPWRTAGPTVNLLTYFPEDSDLRDLDFLPRVLAESGRNDTATEVLCVFGPGQLAKAVAPPGILIADDAKGWEALFKVRSRPALHLMGPGGKELWSHHGPLTNVELKGALHRHLQPGGIALRGLTSSPLVKGMRAPNFIFAYPTGEETTLRKLTGRPVVMIFWRSDASVSVDALRRLLDGQRDAAPDAPVLLAIDDGEDSGYAHGLTDRHRHSAVIVPDPSRLISQPYGITVWPTIIVLDAAGNVQSVHIGDEKEHRI